MRHVSRLLIAFSVLLCAGVARAQEAEGPPPPPQYRFELKGGILAHDVPGLWSGFNLEKGLDFNVELLVGPGLPFLGGTIRPAVGGSFNIQGYTSKGYVDARWEVDLPARLFFGLGLGAAYHDGKLEPTVADRKALGSRVLFHVPVEIGFRMDERQSVSVFFEHVSNGNTAKYNEALDNIGIRYGLKF